ncbi:MAG TPA: pitrilysin family protein [Pyrinomonadaceae bacterium]|jgi:zinc protease|nr:pitrilysin family protein [Pyrinomonadaceae bacterium]
MKLILLVSVLAVIGLGITAQAQSRKVFPYNYTIDDLPNGLRLIVIPTDYPNLVSVYTVVQAGSRNEVEKGKSGYAHFFEHLMFRGSENYPAGMFDKIMQKAGASSNAYTSDDRTVYHATFAKEDLEGIIKLDADRFQHLKYTEEQFKTEAGAVLGEYNKNISSPFTKLYEVMRETAYKKHTYSHTTLGYVEDIRDFPNQFAYSWEFYNRFYRPEYSTVIVVGQVKQADVLAMVKKYYGDWKRGDYVAQIPREPEQEKARKEHIDWPSPTLPLLAVAYRSPSYSDTAKDKVALDLLSIIAFGENSDIYQKLVLEEQKVDFVGGEAEDHVDGELFAVLSRVKEEKDVEYVRDEILKTYKRYTTELIPQQKLDATRSRLRYGFAVVMNSNDAIAGAIAPYVAFKRTPETINDLYNMIESLTPEDIRHYAQQYFSEKNQTIVTLSYKKQGGDE